MPNTPLSHRRYKAQIWLSSLLWVASFAAFSFAQNLPKTTKNEAETVKPAEHGRVLISELRASGPGGVEDTFLELANVSDADITLAGWSLRFAARDGQEYSTTIPRDTVIPTRGHLLFAGRQYSLQLSVPADLRIERAFTGGVQLRDAMGHIVDAVGSRAADKEFRESEGLENFAFDRQAVQYACVRRVAAGRLRDSDDNARDFTVVSVEGKLGANAVTLGAPGPENRHSPLSYQAPPQPEVLKLTSPKTDQTPRRQIVTVFHYAPLRDREARGANQTHGTLLLRCRLINITKKPITQLKFRIDGISNAPADENSGETADVRFLSTAKSNEKEQHAAEPEAGQLDEVLPAALLDEPPAQLLGGGLNSGVTVQMTDKVLEPNSEIDVQCLLGVERPGRYHLMLNGEHFRVTFSGDTESNRTAPDNDFDTQGATLAAIGAPNRTLATDSTIRNSTGNARPASAVNENNKGSALPEEPPLLTATIVLEGNTEEGGEEIEPSSSRVNISSFRVQGESIALRFNGALDAESAGDVEHYSIEVNGEIIDINAASYDAGSQTVSLTVPMGKLRRGDTATIDWKQLRDAGGRLLNGQVGPVEIP